MVCPWRWSGDGGIGATNSTTSVVDDSPSCPATAGAVTAAAIPHLEASGGVAIYFSSVSAHVTPPWVGMGLYAASTVALEKCVES